MLPNFLVFGAARCGTSWLDQNLRQHPDVFLPAGVKEVHFFDNKYDNGLDWYKEIFDDATSIAIGEVTPSYLYYEEVARRLKEHLPYVKLIAIFRNPVERAYSHYWNIAANLKRRNQKFDMSFEEKIAENPRLITDGLYATNLEPYFKLFPREQFLFLLFDDLVNEPQSLLSSVHEFIGVQPQIDSGVANVRVNSAASKIGRSRLYYYLYRACLKSRLYSLATRIEQYNHAAVPQMNADTRRRLIDDYFAQDVKKLEEILDRSLGHWIDD